MLLTTKVMQKTTVVEDTDKWSKQQWNEFIIKNVRFRVIKYTMDNELFPFEKLKQLALNNYINTQELEEEFERSFDLIKRS